MIMRLFDLIKTDLIKTKQLLTHIQAFVKVNLVKLYYISFINKRTSLF